MNTTEQQQLLLWPEREVPRIDRESLVAGLREMGLDPDLLKSVTMSCDVITAEEFVLDDEGYRQLNPTNPNEVWTQTVTYEIH